MLFILPSFVFLHSCRLATLQSSIRDIEPFICATFMYTSFAWPPSGHFLDGVKLCFIIINLRLSYPTWPWTEPRSCLAAIFTTVELTKDILFPVRVVLLWLMDPWGCSVWGCRLFNNILYFFVTFFSHLLYNGSFFLIPKMVNLMFHEIFPSLLDSLNDLSTTVPSRLM